MDHLSNCNIFAGSLTLDSQDAFEELIETLYCGSLTTSLTLIRIQQAMVQFSIPAEKTLEVLYLYHIVNNSLRMFNLNSQDYKAIYDFLVAIDYKTVEIDDNLIINFIVSLAKLRLLRQISDDIFLSFPTTAPYSSQLNELARSWMVFYNGSRPNSPDNGEGPTTQDEHANCAPIDSISSKMVAHSPCTPYHMNRDDLQPHPGYVHAEMELPRRLTKERMKELQNELDLFQQDETDLMCIPQLQNYVMSVPRQSVGVYGSFMGMLSVMTSAVVNRRRGYRTLPIIDNAELVEVSS
ncbi:hypothetical protein V1517DRAFT_330566 [Lipomyces orientalis]|uniref:Uncharacterized protein n=1 Tax=Lipomyces orientalis TaxID=1233043 RepID=A0ACC3TFV0_9ASCO